MLVAGVDLGNRRDFTTVVTLDDLTITAAHRLPRKQKWANVIGQVNELIRPLDRIAVDATGVGAPVVEQIKGPKVTPVIITAGKIHREGETLYLSKSDLVQLLVAYLPRLRVASNAPGREALKEELSRFKIVPGRRGFKFTGKKGGHDDLVIGLALGVVNYHF